MEDERELEFQRQKNAFLSIPVSSLEPYKGQYVVSRDGVIVDSDLDLIELSHRFFGEYGDVSVYISRIGRKPMEVVIDSPEIEYL